MPHLWAPSMARLSWEHSLAPYTHAGDNAVSAAYTMRTHLHLRRTAGELMLSDLVLLLRSIASLIKMEASFWAIETHGLLSLNVITMSHCNSC